MKKWIFGMVVIAVIALAVWYFDPFGWQKPKETTNDEPLDTNKQASNNTPVGEAIQPNVALSKANSATILQLQKELNKAIDLAAGAGVTGLPAKLTEDGKMGSKTIAAIKFVYATAKGYQEGRTVSVSEITWNVSEVTLSNVRFILSTIAQHITRGA